MHIIERLFILFFLILSFGRIWEIGRRPVPDFRVISKAFICY
jgi:hypothetical protein